MNIPNESPADVPRVLIEECVQQWRELRLKRLEAEKVAGMIKDEENAYKDFVIAAMGAQKMEGVVIDQRLSYIREKTFPVADDREAVCAHILATGDLSLLQFRLSEGAIKEQLEEGVEIPGVVMMSRYELGDRKAL